MARPALRCPYTKNLKIEMKKSLLAFALFSGIFSLSAQEEDEEQK
jgi:hypothetical protein